MQSLALLREPNIDILSGYPIPSRFFDWLQEESKNEKIKEATKSFVEPLFSFLLERNCTIVNKEEITDFLNNHSGIVGYLYEAPDVIKKKFGEVSLSLELFFDPEVKNDEGELFLSIETNFDIGKARENLRKIDKEWFLNNFSNDVGKFNLNLEFI